MTRMPSRAYSTAATFASWITAAFVAQYGAACDHAVSPATDAVTMMRPRFWRFIGTEAARIVSNTLVRFICSTSFHLAMATAFIAPSAVMKLGPALIPALAKAASPRGHFRPTELKNGLAMTDSIPLA